VAVHVTVAPAACGAVRLGVTVTLVTSGMITKD
jgi:hypothetical protein